MKQSFHVTRTTVLVPGRGNGLGAVTNLATRIAGSIPSYGEAFVTAAEDIKGLSTGPQLAKTLGLYKDEAGTILRDLKGHTVIEFKFKNGTFGLQSPVEFDGQRKYGFIYGGRTGEAREWIVNKDVSKGGIEIISHRPIR